MKKVTTRILSFVLAMVMVLTTIPTVNAYKNVSDWAEKEVSAMDKLGLIPDSLSNADLTKNITRLDMCRIAVASYEKMTGTTIPMPYEHPFTDTTDPDVERAYVAGLVSGRDDGKFYPYDYLTRCEFFVFVAAFLRAVGFPTYNSDYASLSKFSDGSTVPEWAKKSAQLTVGLGIVKGTGTSLNWSAKTTAEQAIAMFHRTYTTASTRTLNPPEIELPTAYQNLSSWAEKSVMAMDEMGLVPDSVKYSDMTGSITRAEMCQIAVLTYCELTGNTLTSLGSAGNPFSDTNDEYVALAYKLDIVNGYTDGTFKPNNPITRQEYFAVAVNFLNAVDYPYTDAISVDLSIYADGNKVADYAKPSTRLLIAIGVLKGDDNKRLNPTANIVCQEALAIFKRIIDFMDDPFPPASSTTPDSGNQNVHPNPQLAQAVVDYAKQFLGYKYVSGGKDPSTGFDCSGLTYYVYGHFGYNIPRVSRDQWSVSNTVISKSYLLPGDLVFFSSPDNMTPSGIFHVALYIGDNQILHAANANKGVIISSLHENYYAQRFLGGKRVIQ